MQVGGASFAGTAHLEVDELRFRGETRLRIPLASVSGVDVRDGALHVTHAEGLAVLGLGDAVATGTVIFAAAKDAGLTATKVVRFSETDTAEKLVIPVAAR